MKRATGAWTRFWFEPQATAPLALFRIGFGLVVLVWTLALIPDVAGFLGPGAVVPVQPDVTVFTHFEEGSWGLLELFESELAAVLVVIGLIAGSVALILGFFTRLAALVVFVGVVSLERRNPFVFNSGDYLIRNLSFLLLLAPAGASLSLDRWRKAREKFWEFPAHAPWALRLVQIQVSLVYLYSVWGKVQGQLWNEGTAVGYVMRLDDLTRLPGPSAISDSLILTNLATYGTLAGELAVGVLIWNRAARPYVIALGAAMHLAIDYALLVGFFSYAMLVCYLTFIPPERASAAILAVRDRLRRSRRARRKAPVADAPAAAKAPVGTAS